MLDGLLYANGDAVIGINPATDNVPQVVRLLEMLGAIIERYEIPTQSCVHVTNTLQAMERGAPVDLVFQSIGGTEATNRSFGIDLAMLDEAHQAALSLCRGADFDGQIGDNVMYFETGQGSALSANGHHGCATSRPSKRAPMPWRGASARYWSTPWSASSARNTCLTASRSSVPGWRTTSAPSCSACRWAVDVCYTNHAEADQNDMDILLTMLGVAGCNFVMGIPGSDDIMLNYQTTSFHDALYAREAPGLRPAPEFEAWLARMQIVQQDRHSACRPRLPRHSCPRWRISNEKRPAGFQHPARSLVCLAPLYRCPHCTGPYRDQPADPGTACLPAGACQRADAVHASPDWQTLEQAVQSLGCQTVRLHSRASDRPTYLQRPDWGRRLDEASRTRLQGYPLPDHARTAFDIAFVIADGLSACAIERQAIPLLQHTLPCCVRQTGALHQWHSSHKDGWQLAMKWGKSCTPASWRY